MPKKYPECEDRKCEHFGRRHYHIRSIDGGITRFIVDKPKEPIKVVDRSAEYDG
jgi:hypothetical protein